MGQRFAGLGAADPRLNTFGCDSDIIKLLGRWKSDTLMDYLHQQSLPVFRRLASLMFNNGHHTFLPAETVPATA